VTTFSTPEEAARGRLREKYVRVVGVAIRGDQAVVAQVMNADGYPAAYEVETAMCYRTGDGWEEGSSGNSDTTFIPTGEDRCTVVWWSEAPEGATAARLSLGEQEQTVPVKDGFFFVAFDDVPWHDFDIRANWPSLPPGASGFVRSLGAGDRHRLDWFHELPEVEEWIRAGDEGPA
jgi:hypothetical protein